jgi:hypothetical protein
VVNEKEPWRNHDTYREKYASYRGRHDQPTIRDSHDSKYFVNKNHPEHNKWQSQQRHEALQKNAQVHNKKQDVQNKQAKAVGHDRKEESRQNRQ